MMVMESLAPLRLLRSFRDEADDGDCPKAPRALEAPRALAEADGRDVPRAAAFSLDVEAAWGSEAEGALQPIIPPIAKAATPARVSLLRVELLRAELFFIACPSRSCILYSLSSFYSRLSATLVSFRRPQSYVGGHACMPPVCANGESPLEFREKSI